MGSKLLFRWCTGTAQQSSYPSDNVNPFGRSLTRIHKLLDTTTPLIEEIAFSIPQKSYSSLLQCCGVQKAA